jgi:uncharacterized membrane protein
MLAIFNQHENPVTVTIQLLKQLKVKVTDYTVNEAILNHPDYPSILCISDALNSWHVENTVIRTENVKLSELPLPLIAFTNTKSVFVLVTEIKDNKIFYKDDGNKSKSKALLNFLKEFKGVVLLAEANKNSGEADYNKTKYKENIVQLKIPAFIIVGLIVIVTTIINISIINSSLVIYFFFLLILKFAGLLTTSLLLWYEADKANPVLQKICSSGGKTNCNAILNSKASKIFGLSWSEIGFFYFSSGFLFLLTAYNSQLTANLQLIQLLNLIALPYVFFSIFYQWRIAKQWCPLCLTVQTILILEFITTISFGALDHLQIYQIVNIAALSTFFVAFILPIVAWFIIKPLVLNQQKAKQDFRSLQRIKFNAEIFNALLERQKHVTVPADGLGIILGNADATNTLIKVCNPYCGPCAKAHPEIERLLEENQNLKVQIIFTATNDENDFRNAPVKHLLAIAENNDETKTKCALDDWYLADKKDYKVFAEKYTVNGELKRQEKKIDAMNAWCDKIEISFTPTIFFNNYQLPDAYSIGDLKYFLLDKDFMQNK